MKQKPSWNDLPFKSKRNAVLFYIFLVALFLASWYVSTFYAWPWFVKWCLRQ